MCVLAGLFGVYLIHGYYTAGWITAAFVYHLAAFLSAGAYLLLAHAPAAAHSAHTDAADVKTDDTSKPAKRAHAKEPGKSIAAASESSLTGTTGRKTAAAFKPELAILRIFILTVFDFSVIEMLSRTQFCFRSSLAVSSIIHISFPRSSGLSSLL